jgi:hypothetical protein
MRAHCDSNHNLYEDIVEQKYSILYAYAYQQHTKITIIISIIQTREDK